MLTRSTPEGARDYLVPSRIHHGQFYALPQSPQIFKQILMIGGPGPLLSNRALLPGRGFARGSATGIHAAGSGDVFPTQQAIFGVIEQVMVRACAVAGIEAKAPFRHMEYREAIRRYGIDKPDLRFGMELREVTPQFAGAAKSCASKAACKRSWRRGRQLFAKAAGRIGGTGQRAGRARALHHKSGGGRREIAAGENAGRGGGAERSSRRWKPRPGT